MCSCDLLTLNLFSLLLVSGLRTLLRPRSVTISTWSTLAPVLWLEVRYLAMSLWGYSFPLVQGDLMREEVAAETFLGGEFPV